MIHVRKNIEHVGADIIETYIPSFFNRYSNRYDKRMGSRYINNEPCPLCERFLKNNSCTTCPMDREFGLQDGRLDNSGCKVWIRRMWGPITFGDFPKAVIRSSNFNPQLSSMHNWLRNYFKLK